jgi:peptide/nickel transport system substrate-binding protein
MKGNKLFDVLSRVAIAALLLAACGAPATPVSPTAGPNVVATEASMHLTQTAAAPVVEPTAAPTEVPAVDFEPMSHEAPDCEYGGQFKSIEAVDQFTVKMTLCVPDPAFPAKVAFSSFAINDADYLDSTGGGGDLIESPNGTGPYMFDRWERGTEIVFTRFDGYWGEPAAAQNLIFRWSAESAQRLLELQAGTVDGIDNPGPDDFEVISGDSNLQLKTRNGTNIFYVGVNNTYAPFDNERVRQAFAMAIDRQRLVDNFYPPGSTVASQFMPPSIFGYSQGQTWYEFNPEEAQRILEEEGVLPGFSTTITYRDVVRGYLPNPGVVAQDIQAQLAEIGVTAEIVVMESGAFLDAADRGQIDGFHLLGWGADYPDATNFLDFHFGPGASDQFGEGFQDVWDALGEGATKSTAADRQPWYDEANELIKQHVPMIPVAHGGNGAAFKADVDGAYASDIGAEQFALMTPGDRDTFVWLQNGEPAGLYCADETDGEALRACEQVMQSLLAYEPGSGTVVASLAETWEASEDLTEWTFNLRQGVKFHNGADLDANDVVLSYLVQWDAEHPLHVGRDGSFTYFPGLFGPFLNAPPAQ